MLERTSACLDTGVRFSLRQKSLFPKSRRLLAVSFWSTAAPDVDNAFPYHSLTPISSPDLRDAPFLDFLYPAPTQAFATRLSQWSRKNNFPYIPRAYSSLTTPKDSPKTPSKDPTSSRLRHDLRSILADKESTSPLDIEQAWNLCSSPSSVDPELLQQAAIWFSERKDTSADRHAVDLFVTLPDYLKSAAAYRAAISSHLAIGQVSDAVNLHTHASRLPYDGSIGSDALMLQAVSTKNWPLALSIFQQWETYTADHSSEQTIHEFWAPTKRLKLRDHVANLRELCCSESGKADTELRRLFGILLNQFVLSCSRMPIFVQKSFAADTARGRVKQQIQLMHDRNLASKDAFERIINTLCTVSGRATNPNCSALVMFAYNLYHRSGHFAPSENILMQMLRFWRDYNLAFAGKGLTRSYVGQTSLFQDWTKYHGKPVGEAFVIIMDAFARLGDVRAVEEHANLYKSLHPEGLSDSAYLWPLIYVHATNASPVDAVEQLDRMQQEYGVVPNLRCWNIALHAYDQADDLLGAAAFFERMRRAGIDPDCYTYGTLLNLYAKRGDVDGVIDLLDFAKSNGLTKPTTHMLNSMIVALTNNLDHKGALRALEQTVQTVQADEAEGSLTLCFNTMLVANASRRDLSATMAVYRHMKKVNVPLDVRSYSALMLVLCSLRQSPSAHKILKTVMPSENVRPMAFHYSILTAGYINQKMYAEAVGVEKEMSEARVRQTPSSCAVALKARALLEHSNKPINLDDPDTHLQLDFAIEDYKSLLNDTRVRRQGKEPALGFRNESPHSEVADVGYLLYIHGRRQSFEAVRSLLQMYRDKLSETKSGITAAPMVRLLTTLMFVHSQAGEFAEVDKYWDLVKSKVDELRVTHIPATDLVGSASDESASRDPATAQIPPTYRFMLSRPLEYYMLSQFAQSTSSRLVPLITELHASGYVLDNKTWNKYIVQLCKTSPPRALLAYTLVEKYMMNEWPGFISQRHASIKHKLSVFPRKQARKEGLEFIKIRYLHPDQLVPQYRTLVYLASALLELRALKSSGISVGNMQGITLRELKAQVGTIPEIRERAPKTMNAVQSMPRVLDRIQMTLLKTT
jgi:pentatricopeptide repeat-containing protein PET309